MMLSPTPAPSTSFQPQLKSDYFFNDDPAIAQSPLQLSSPFPSPSPQQQPSVSYLDDEEEEHVPRRVGEAAPAVSGRQQMEWSRAPPSSHTQPLPSSLHHDSSTGSDTPSPIPQPKAVRGTPPVYPQPSAAPSASTSASSSTATSPAAASSTTSSIPSPMPFRPQSGHDGPIEYVGPFILGRVLGRGCTGTVRLGVHKHTGFEVAFKIIDKKYLNSDAKLWKKVKREIAILKLIEHPHVLQLYDVLETEHRLYLVLEHVKGGELFDYIVSKGRLDRDESLRLTAQIVSGLEHCHAHSICHRDLKPENLLLDADNKLKLCFPQEDHEVLTRDGFKDFTHFRRALASGEAVSVACPVRRRSSDPLDQFELQYHDVVGLDSLVDKTTMELVEMRQRDEQCIGGNCMDLQLTPEHKLPVTLTAHGSASASPVRLLTAREVLNARPACAELVCHAVHGVSDPAPDQPLPFAAALDLTTDEQIDAFVELYGYWLGDGSMNRGADAISFSTYKDADVDYLDELFGRLPLLRLTRRPFERQPGFTKVEVGAADADADDDKDDQLVDADDEGEDDVTALTPARVRWRKCEYLIYHPRWVSYFAEQYGHMYMYWGPATRGAAVRGAHRRGSAQPMRRYSGFYDQTINNGQTLRDVLVEMEKGQLLVKPDSVSLSTQTRALSSSSTSSSSTSSSSPDSPPSTWTRTLSASSTSSIPPPLEDPEHLLMPESPQSPLPPSTASSRREDEMVEGGEGAAIGRPSSPQPPDAEDMASAKWAWWWVWERLCARRLRLLLRGLRFAHGDQSTELAAEKRLVTKGGRVAKGRASEGAKSGGEADDARRASGMPLTGCAIWTASARCRDEYQHMALRAGFTCTTRLKRRVGHTDKFGQTSVRPLWQVSYHAITGQERLGINPGDELADSLGLEQLRHDEISLLHLDTPKRVWCIGVPTADHLIMVRRVKRDAAGQVVESSRPTVVSNCDFGMAQLMKNSSILKTSCGSPHYASPEIIEGQSYDAKVTDVWSIGVILYALITGSLPFDHDNIPTLLSMVTKGHYTTPAHVPSDVSHLISRMLTVDPKKRIRLSEIRKHPCYKGTTHFANLKPTSSWPYNTPSASSASSKKKDREAAHKKRKSLPTLHMRSADAAVDSPGDLSSDSDGETFVDEGVLTDLEALGLDLNGNRDELRAKITQRPTNPDQPNIERVFYRLLKKRRNSRLEQLSLLSPKISPRHYSGAFTGPHFMRAQSEPDSTALQFRQEELQLEQKVGAQVAGSAPSSRTSSAVSAAQELLASPPNGMQEGEWVQSAAQSSRSAATTEGNASTASQSSTGSQRVPISPFALDDDRRSEEDFPYSGILPRRQQSAPSTTGPEYSDLPSAGHVSRESSAAAYYNRMVARVSPPTMLASLSVPPSPYLVPTAAAVASAPSSPFFSTSSSPPTPPQLSTSAPYPTSVMRPGLDSDFTPTDPSTSSHRYPSNERRGSVPISSAIPPSHARQRASSAISSPHTDTVARRLFIAEEKFEHTDSGDALDTDSVAPRARQPPRGPSPHHRNRSIDVPSSMRSSHKTLVDSPPGEYVSSPRFHRVRFNPSNPTSHSSSTPSSALLPSPALDSPVSKRSWFSSIFSRRPSLDLFNKAGKKKAASSLPPPPSAGSKSAITGIYSSKTTLAIADEVRRALKSAGIRYTVTKGNSNGASLFECEVGGEEEKKAEHKGLGLRFLTRRKSTTAIEPHMQPPPQTVDPRFPAGRRASVGNAVVGALSRTAPIDTAHIPVADSAGPSSPKKRAGGIPLPPAPRHAALVKARGKSPTSDEEQTRGAQSAGSTPRNGAAAPGVLAPQPPPTGPQHARHLSLRSSPPGAPSITGARRRSNSNDEAVEGEAGDSAVAPSPVVKLIVEITSHHSNDLRCVRFLHVSGDEQLYRQVQTDIQQRLTLNTVQ